MLSAALPNARYLLADKAYDADHWRGYLRSRHIQPVIPNKSNRKQPHPFNNARYKGRNVIERMFGRLKDFRRVATRYDKNANNFLAALCLAALICYWILMRLDPRVLSEYLEPEARLEEFNIADTIVFFGSARIKSQEDVEASLLEVQSTGCLAPFLCTTVM